MVPCMQAKCSAVMPRSVVAWTSAPAASSGGIAPGLPSAAAAQWRAVQPNRSARMTDPASRSIATASCLPWTAA